MTFPIKNTLLLIASWIFLLALSGCHRGAAPAGVAEVGCAGRLRQIAMVKEQWAAATGAASNATPTWDDLAPYFRHGWLPECPGGGKYTIGSLSELPTCSIAAHNEYFKAHLQDGQQ